MSRFKPSWNVFPTWIIARHKMMLGLLLSPVALGLICMADRNGNEPPAPADETVTNSTKDGVAATVTGPAAKSSTDDPIDDS